MKEICIDPVTEYAAKVVDGDLVACRYVRLACERHLRDLDGSDFTFDRSAVALSGSFSRLLKHYKGPDAGLRFVPELWQEFFKGSIFGWKRSDGTRRFRIAYLEVARKNGKTFYAADIGLQGLTLDGEAAAEVYSIATKRDQAKIVWRDACALSRKCPSLAARTREYQSYLLFKPTSSIFLPLSKDTKSLDGINPSLGIGDEVHAWEDDDLFNQIDDALGARAQPLFLLVTTAGKNMDGICYRLRDHLIAILEGDHNRSYIDDEFFGVIYTLDEADDWRDDTVWKKANPNLGVSKNWDYLRRKVSQAIQIPSLEFTVKNKQFDIWTAGKTKWLDMERWDSCSGKIDLKRLSGCSCHLGIDLSTNQDLTAVVALFPPGPYDEWTILPRLYLPEDCLDLRQREDRRPYKYWKKQGYLLTTPGDSIDLQFIKRDILTLSEEYQVIDAGFDPWKATEIASALIDEGFDMVQMRQGHATLGSPTLTFENYVLKKMFRHAGHPVLRWMAGNATVIFDSNGNIRPDKTNAKKRIDGIVATIMALGRAQIYRDEGPPELHVIDV